MKNLVPILYCLLLILEAPSILSAHAAQPSVSRLELPKIDTSLVRAAESCRVKSPKKFVYFFKQWHLSPSVDTHADPSKSRSLPQHDNQTAIFRQLDQWIGAHSSFELIAEGCPAPRAIDDRSPEKFNGWSMADLANRSSSPDYADLVTNVGFKLEAKWKSQLNARCGDNADAIKKNLLAFSDARGILGFLTRLEQFKNDPVRAKPYLDGVIEIYHLPKNTTLIQAMGHLARELSKSIDEIDHWIDVRNQKLVEEIVSGDSKVVTVVFGGMHASGVRKLLEERGIGCKILEPQGYQDDESKMLETLRGLVNQRLIRAM